jgi:hypothetical protein
MRTSTIVSSFLLMAGSTLTAHAALIQRGINLSNQCQAVVGGVASSPLGQCLNIPGLIVIANTPKDQSLVDPIDSYLQSICKAPACDTSIFPQLVTNVTTNCATDLQSLGLTQSQIDRLGSAITEPLQQYYPVGRKIACLQDTSKSNSLCVTTTLKAIESASGTTLSINNLLSNGLATISQVEEKGLTKEAICTPCIQAAWSTLKTAVPVDQADGLKEALTNLCGANFESATPPTTINSRIDNKSPSNGALSSFPTSPLLAISMMGALAAGFTLLA